MNCTFVNADVVFYNMSFRPSFFVRGPHIGLMEPVNLSGSHNKVLPAAARRFSKGIDTTKHTQPLCLSQHHDLQTVNEMEPSKANKKELKLLEKGRLESVGVLFVQVLKLKNDVGGTRYISLCAHMIRYAELCGQNTVQ